MDIFIVEDNPAIRRFFMQYIPSLNEGYRLIGISSSVEETNILLKTLQPDVLILDIELPDGKGFDVLQHWNQENDKDSFDGYVIFATAHNHYALKAIKYSAFDYLLKPIQEEELKESLLRAKQQVQNKALLNKHLNTQLNTLQQNIESVENEKALLKSEPQKIVLSDAERVYLVVVDEIIHCEAEGNYTLVHLTEDRKIVISKPLLAFEEMLPQSHFYRVHRSHLINLDHFSFLDKKDGGTVHLKNGSLLPVSRRRKDILMNKIKER